MIIKRRLKLQSKKYVNKKLQYKFNRLIKNDKLNKKIKRTYGYYFYQYYNKVWKQKINWKFKWNTKKKNWKGLFNYNYYNRKIQEKNQLFLKNMVIKKYLNKKKSIIFIKKNISQFSEMYNKIKMTHRYLSNWRKKNKLNWYKIKYKRKFINQFVLLLSQTKYNKIKFKQKSIIFKKRNTIKNNDLKIIQNIKPKYKQHYYKNMIIKKYLKYNKKNIKFSKFIIYNKQNKGRWKPYWTYAKIYKRRRYWKPHKNRVWQYSIKRKFSKKYIKKIRKFLFKHLIKKYTNKVNLKKYIINQYGIKDSRAYYRKEKKKQRILNAKLKNKWYQHRNKNKIWFRRYYQYMMFDKIKSKLRNNYLIAKKLIKFIINVKTDHNLLTFKSHKKIKVKNLLNIKQISLLKVKKNLINLSKIKSAQLLPIIKLSFYNLSKINKNKQKLKKYKTVNILKTKHIIQELKQLKFWSKINWKIKNKKFYDFKNSNNNLFNSLILLKQKKQILYLNNLLPNSNNLFYNKRKNKGLFIKKVKILKKIYKIKLLNYIKITKVLKNKINKNKQKLTKVSFIKKVKILNTIGVLNAQKLKVQRFVNFYKSKLKNKIKWVFIDAERYASKAKKYNNFILNKKFKNFVLSKQTLNLIKNNDSNNNKLKLYSYNLSKHIDDNNKWMNYYIKKSFKWKFFKKRWHYRYSKWKKLLYFKKLMRRAKDSYRKIQKNFIFIKLFRTNFNNFMGINEEEVINKWFKLRRSNNNNDNTNIVARFNQMLQLKLDGLVIFLGLSPSRFLAQELIRCGGLRINGIIITNKNHFLNLNNILQVDLQVKEDLKLFYSFNHWIKVKARLKYVEFLQVMWPMMMFMLIRWPYNHELYEDSVLTSRWLRFFIRYFPIKISKYKKLKVKWYKF